MCLCKLQGHNLFLSSENKYFGYLTFFVKFVVEDIGFS